MTTMPQRQVLARSPCSQHMDDLIGSEPDAREITEAAANKLKSAKTLKQMAAAAAAEWTH